MGIQATRLKKGMLIQMDGALLRVLELHHITPGNKRGHVQSKLRDIRVNRMVDHKFRSEDSVERAILDEREMQYL
jgi:elongation factor P